MELSHRALGGTGTSEGKSVLTCGSRSWLLVKSLTTWVRSEERNTFKGVSEEASMKKDKAGKAQQIVMTLDVKEKEKFRKKAVHTKMAETKKYSLFCRAWVSPFQCSKNRSQNVTGPRVGVKIADTITGIPGTLYTCKKVYNTCFSLQNNIPI